MMCIMKKPFSPKLLFKLCLWSASALCLAKPGLAATLTVTNASDGGPGSLRQAIADAALGDTINFAVTGTIALTTGELLITNDLSIAGPGATNLALSGQGATRVFEIGSNATVSISGLTIRNGRAPTPGGSGGGFYNAGSLTLSACILTGNGGGGNFYLGGDGGSGGGI